MFQQRDQFNNVRLYVRRVFITDECKELIPEYLHFVKGLVDSNDLPLNVSREMLQQNSTMRRMKKHIVKKVLDKIIDIAEDDEKYKKFYGQFGKNIKFGTYQDDTNRTKLSKLVRFYSLKHKTEQISLTKYVEDMKENQKDIYFITGDSVDNLKDSPFVETLKKRDYDVLLLVDPIDEYLVQKLTTFDEKKLVDITKEGLKLEDQVDEDKKSEEEKKNEVERYEKLCQFFKTVLDTNIEKAVVSQRKFDSPCILTTGQWGLTANMERITKAQALGSNMMPHMRSSKTLELNKENKLVQLLESKYREDHNDKVVKNMIWLLYETSLLNSGFTLDKPTSFTGRIYNMLTLGLSGNDFTEDDQVEDRQEDDVLGDQVPGVEDDEMEMVD